MTDPMIRNLVIVGGGTAGWMAAAAFSRFLDPRHVRVTVVESDEIGTVGVGEATIPPLARFNQMVGLDEAQFLAVTNGTAKLGIEFIDWGAQGDRYFHPFGRYGQDLEGINFHQLWLRERALAQSQGRPPVADIAAWSVGSLAAAAGRFAPVPPKVGPPLTDLDYAYHIDAAAYAGLLRRLSESRGARRIEGRVTDVVMTAGDGDGDGGDRGGRVDAVVLDGGRRVEGDLFLDCTGFRALLIGDALGTPYQDWRHWLPCDRAVAIPCAASGPPEPYTRATARGAGWQWRIPLQHRIGNGLVYASDHLDEAGATALLLGSLEGAPLAPPRHLRFTTGRRDALWRGNVVALGLSGGFLEPLESTSIHLIQAGIARLIELFPDKRFDPVERDEYNRQMRDLYDDVRDFVILHYHATARDDTPFWRHVRDMDVPDSLARKIALFRGKGRSFRTNAELFAVSSWVAVCLGQNIVPQGYEPVVDALDDAKVATALDQMRRGYADAVQALPTHATFLASLTGPRPQAAAPARPAIAPSPSPADGVATFSFEQESPFGGPAEPEL